MITFFKKSLSVLAITFLFINVSNAAINTNKGFADIVEPLMPAVVNISTTQKSYRAPYSQTPMDDFNQFLEKFMGPNWQMNNEPLEQKKLISLGSGFIIDKEGHIVTNYHVIAEADEISVKLSGGKDLIAKVVGVDKKTDIAVLKVDSIKPLTFVKFGDSDKARVGDWVITIGNPFGLGSSVTTGIVSAHGRDIISEGIVDNFIQTDAAINKGNSGGPMFNLEGDVIGINTIILSPSGGNIGIGFSTPTSLAEPIINQLKKTGKVKRGALGIRMQLLTDEISDSLGLKSTEGALVVEVMKKSAASKAGLESGDIITTFNSKKIKTIKQLVKIVSTAPIGKKLTVTILRNGKVKTLTVTLIEDLDSNIEESEEGKDISKEIEKKYSKFLAQDIKGAYIAKLTPELKEKFNMDRATKGLIVLNYKRRSMWHQRGFKPGDVIISANQIDLISVDQLKTIIQSAKLSKKKSILLLMSRGNTQLFISIPID